MVVVADARCVAAPADAAVAASVAAASAARTILLKRIPFNLPEEMDRDTPAAGSGNHLHPHVLVERGREARAQDERRRSDRPPGVVPWIDLDADAAERRKQIRLEARRERVGEMRPRLRALAAHKHDLGAEHVR